MKLIYSGKIPADSLTIAEVNPSEKIPFVVHVKSGQRPSASPAAAPAVDPMPLRVPAPVFRRRRVAFLGDEAADYTAQVQQLHGFTSHPLAACFAALEAAHGDRELADELLMDDMSSDDEYEYDDEEENGMDNDPQDMFDANPPCFENMFRDISTMNPGRAADRRNPPERGAENIRREPHAFAVLGFDAIVNGTPQPAVAEEADIALLQGLGSWSVAQIVHCYTTAHKTIDRAADLLLELND
jgi:hypothetical protein